MYNTVAPLKRFLSYWLTQARHTSGYPGYVTTYMHNVLCYLTAGTLLGSDGEQNAEGFFM
jgi:hypothetical protein